MRGSQRHPSGILAALLGAALLVASCQDGYPIAATRCDRYCHVRQATECGSYNPAACVSECELASGDPACSDRLDELLACVEKPGLKIVCDIASYKIVPECLAEYTRLGKCAEDHPRYGPGAPE